MRFFPSLLSLTQVTSLGLILAVPSLFLTGCETQQTKPLLSPAKAAKQANNTWFKAGQTSVQLALHKPIVTETGKAKNIILFIGDGMSISTITAARILAGQQLGQTGEEYQLSFEKMPFTGLVKTYNTNQQTPDSAGTMTAMMTGVKTRAGVLSVSSIPNRTECSARSKAAELTSIFDLAEDKGLATGIVSTARITHATPAATYAKTTERNWEGDNKLSAEAKAHGCLDIAQQLINYDHGDGFEVVMGGGRRYFLPKKYIDIEGKHGKRQDGQNLIQIWQHEHPTGQVVQTQAEFNAIKTKHSGPILGLFNSSHMQYETDRQNDIAGEPSLSEMTAKAIKVLSQNKQGYVLMVEAGRIDLAHHAGSAYNALTETIELSKAVQVALNNTSNKDTLIMVTADHSHVFTMAGYPTRGNPILGKVIGNNKKGLPKKDFDLDADGLPYTTLGYTNGRGFAEYEHSHNASIRYQTPIEAGRQDLTDVDTQDSGYHQEALIPHSSETHSGEDVAIFASGPGAHLVTGVIEQNVIFHIMNYMGNLSKQ